MIEAPAPAPLPAPVVVAPPVSAEPEPELSRTVKQLRAISGSSHSTVWIVVAGLMALAVLGLIAGYAASMLAVR